MYDERFARQYRYEPPSEFPQISPCTGIVHHLSGPNRYAHTQTSLNRSVSCWCKNPSSHFHCANRFNHPWTRTYVRLLGPCFKTGRKDPFTHQAILVWVQQGTFTHPRACFHEPRGFPTHTWQMKRRARSTTIIGSKTTTPQVNRWRWLTETHHNMQQSHQATLDPFASLSAISGTFNSLSKVLFTFPSWYLFAIGLESIFSFRWNLPPNLRSNPEERDSQEVHRTQGTTDDERDSHPHWCFFPKDLHLCLHW